MLLERARLLLLFSALCLTTLVLPGCPGRCPDLMESYEAAIRAEIARAGTGTTTLGSGEYHLGLILSPAMVQELLLDASTGLEALHTRLSVEQVESRGRAAVEILAQPVLDSMAMVAGTSGEVQLRCRLEARVTSKVPGARSDYFLLGGFTISGRLVFGVDDQGTPLLALVLGQFTDETLDLGTTALPPSIATAVQQYLEPALSERMLEAVRELTLVKFPPVMVGPLYMNLSPSGLAFFPEHEGLFLGFVTNLRPTVTGSMRVGAVEPPGDLAYLIHPGLGEAVLRLAMIEGRIPGRYDAEGWVDVQGPIHVTLQSVTLSGDSVSLVFDTWDETMDHCRCCTWTATARIARDMDEGLDVIPQEMIATPPAEGVTPCLDGDLWLRAAFVTGSMDLLSQLINLPWIHLGTGRHLSLLARSIRLEGGLLVLDLRPGGDMD